MNIPTATEGVSIRDIGWMSDYHAKESIDKLPCINSANTGHRFPLTTYDLNSAPESGLYSSLEARWTLI